jgi:hypothetical protein
MTLSKAQVQQLLANLRKLATPWSDETGPASVPTVNLSSPSRGIVSRGNPAIARMQEALQALARAVTSQLNLQNSQKQEAAGRDSFGDFFAKHYLRNTDIPSVEFTPDPTKTKIPEKDPRIPSKLNWVMDTMQRIGGEKSENFADGIWGPRTNASLVNSYALAQGLLNFAQEFQLPVHSFNSQDLERLKPAIREDDSLTPQQKNDVASVVMNNINAIRQLYNEVKQGILEKPQWRAYIENDKPYLQYKSQQLGQDQLQTLQQSFPNGFTVPLYDEAGTTAPITIADLATPATLQKWVSQFPQANLTPYNVVASVIRQLSGEE